MSLKKWHHIMVLVGLVWAIVGIFTHNLFDFCLGNFVMLAAKIDILEDNLKK